MGLRELLRRTSEVDSLSPLARKLIAYEVEMEGIEERMWLLQRIVNSKNAPDTQRGWANVKLMKMDDRLLQLQNLHIKKSPLLGEHSRFLK